MSSSAAGRGGTVGRAHTTRLTRAAGLLVAGGLIYSVLPITGAEAVAKPCAIKGFAPNGYIVGAAPVARTFAVSATGCPVKSWKIVFDDPTGGTVATSAQPNVTISPQQLSARSPGIYPLKITVTPTNANATSTVKEVSFSLLRRSTWGTTFSASPEAAKKGKGVTLKGTFKRIGWNSTKNPSYSGYPHQSVLVQFRATGATAYTTIKTVKSGVGGRVSTTVPAVRSGSWRLNYLGNSVTGSSRSTEDSVTVS